MFYVQTRTYRARVGPVAKGKTETCEHCGKTHEIVAHAWGEGTSVAMYDFSGGRLKNQEAAFESARRNATALADSALRANPCPACGRPSAALQGEVEAAERAYQRRRKLATFVPLACGAVAFLPFALPAFRALAYSAWPLGSALAVAFGVAALVLTVLLWPRKHPLRPTTAVLSYRQAAAESAYRGDGPEEAFLPWPAPAKPPGTFGSLRQGVTFLLATLALLGFASFGFGAKATRYDTLHIVSMAAPGTKIRVSQPGAADQVFDVRPYTGDAYHVTAKVLRLSSPHPLTVTEEGIVPYTASLTLPPLKVRMESLILTLRAKAAGKCLALEKSEEGLTPERVSDVHPDLVFSRSYASTWLTAPSASMYSSAYRLLPCTDALAREVRIASLSSPGTKIVVSQTGKSDQTFTVGTHTGSDAFLIRARVYGGERDTFTVREGERDREDAYEQTFTLPAEPPTRNSYESKPTWLIVTGAAAQNTCVGVFTTRYGDERLGGVLPFAAEPPFRKLSPTATDLWSVPHVDVWLTETPKTVTGSRYSNLTRTSVRVKSCTVLDLVSRLGAAKKHEEKPVPSDEDDEDDDARSVPKPAPSASATLGVKGRTTPPPMKHR